MGSNRWVPMLWLLTVVLGGASIGSIYFHWKAVGSLVHSIKENVLLFSKQEAPIDLKGLRQQIGAVEGVTGLDDGEGADTDAPGRVRILRVMIKADKAATIVPKLRLIAGEMFEVKYPFGEQQEKFARLQGTSALASIGVHWPLHVAFLISLLGAVALTVLG